MSGYRTLAVDASGTAVSAAVVTDARVLCEICTDTKSDHSTTLLPTIDAVLRRSDTRLADIDFFSVTSGPGSFTGLRIGAATIKGLAFFSKKPIVPVPTLTALSYNTICDGGLTVPLLDARRRQAYAAIFRDRQIQGGFLCADIDDVITTLKPFDEPITFLGDGLPVFRARLESSVLRPRFAHTALSRVRAAVVAVAAFDMVEADGIGAFGYDFDNVYVRAPQAEREAAQCPSL